MSSFNDSIEQLLWPEKREHDSVLGTKIPGRIDRTTQQSFLRISSGYLPDILQSQVGFGQRYLPSLFGQGGIEIGPIPTGTPVNLIANTNILSESSDPAQRLEHGSKVANLVLTLKRDLLSLPKDATDEQARQRLGNLVDRMLEVSKCPDYIVNRGHYFGTGFVEPGDASRVGEAALSDSDKRALIEFIKTF